MKVMLLLMGAPGVGKSTFIQDANAQEFVVSPDAFREELSPLVEREVDGVLRTVVNNEFLISKQAFAMTEVSVAMRAELGELIIIDAQNLRRRNYKEFLNIAKEFDYEVYLVDIQEDITLEELLLRNESRGHKYVPQEVITNSYNLYQNLNTELEVISKKVAKDLISKANKSTYVKKDIMEEAEVSEDFYEELRLALMSDSPSKILMSKDMLSKLSKYLPELLKLASVDQSPKWHPEGDALTHTMLVVDAARNLLDEVNGDKEQFMYAALLHDIGKYDTSRVKLGNITSLHHDTIGAHIARKLLKRLAPNKDMKYTTKLIDLHMYGHKVLVMNKLSIDRLLSTHGADFIYDLLILNTADNALFCNDSKILMSKQETLAKLEVIKR